MRAGEIVDVENVVSYITPELAYIVRTERSEAKVGGQEAVTPISLRVTMIMRSEDGVWKIVHGTQTRSRRLDQPNQSFSNSPSRNRRARVQGSGPR